MSTLRIPESGLTLENSRGSSSKAGSAGPPILGLTISNSMIEEMIKCVQNGKNLELSLGEHPNIRYGTKTQHLISSPEPFPLDIFQSFPNSNNSSETMSSKKSTHAGGEKVGTVSFNLKTTRKAPPKTTSKNVLASSSSATAGADAALAQLQNSIASENAKKTENQIKFMKDGLLVPPKRGAAKGSNKGKLFAASRSIPASPALSAGASPSLGPTSVPLSQQQAENAKAARKPIVHFLAVGPTSQEALRAKVPQATKHDFEQTLEKVGDCDASDKVWSLRKNFWKELDVWSFEDYTSEERQKAIDNAVRTYDKMRLGIAEPEWDRLLVKSERGMGKCLSKLQAQIAQGSIARTPKIGAGSGRDTPTGDDDDIFGEKGTGRSGSQPPAAKPKKMTEKEAQAKRLLSKNPSKAAIKAASKPTPKSTPKSTPKMTPKVVPAKKSTQTKAATNGKVLSSEFVDESDEDDESSAPSKPPAKPAPKPAPKPAVKAPAKRSREEDVDTSDSSVPLSKKLKKEIAPSHRASDGSQLSRTTNSSHSHYSVSHKTKSNNSPQKSSPLASSPPTNASDIEESVGRSSSSASPARISTKISRSPIHKRHGKSSSVSSSTSGGSQRYIKSEVMDMARRYRSFYPNYIKLYQELTSSNRRDSEKEKKLLDMHNRLAEMKRIVMENVVVVESP